MSKHNILKKNPKPSNRKYMEKQPFFTIPLVQEEDPTETKDAISSLKI